MAIPVDRADLSLALGKQCTARQPRCARVAAAAADDDGRVRTLGVVVGVRRYFEGAAAMGDLRAKMQLAVLGEVDDDEAEDRLKAGAPAAPAPSDDDATVAKTAPVPDGGEERTGIGPAPPC